MPYRKLSRRDFLKLAGITAGTAMAENIQVLPVDALAPDSASFRPPAAATAIVKNKSPLVQTPFIPLALGAVRADGWLLNQLQLLNTGATGNAELLYPELGSKSAWLGASQSAMAAKSDWERPTYYVKGLVALAYTLNDTRLTSKLQRWINWTIRSQVASGANAGAFGPSWNYTDWWPRMPMLYALKDFYEATNDSRVLPFLTRYFQFQANHLAAHPLTSWAKARVGDTLDVVFWLYNRTGDAALLTLADTLRRQGFDFTEMLTNNHFAPEPHNVNVSQYLKTPALAYLKTNLAADLNAFLAGNAHLLEHHGQVTGMSSGTEDLAGRSSIQGVELCAIVERMESNEIAQMIIGDPSIGDQLEKIAFNALPGAMDKTNKIHEYYTLPNQYESVSGSQGFQQDYDSALVLGPNSGYPCCRFNLHMGWPYYVKNMWAGTDDDGIAAMAYGPSHATVRVGTGSVDATITESTNYPFEEQIRFTVHLPSAADFPLKLRIPAWTSGPSVSVNGESQSGVSAGSFFTIHRTWNNGDAITLQVPMPLQISTQINNSLAIERGPLVFALKMTENWTRIWTGFNDFHEYEIRPANAWNYGLQLDRNNPGASIQVLRSEMPDNPFVTATTPIQLTATARKVPWDTVRNGLACAEVPASPCVSTHPAEQVTLIPFGAENTRITYFPEIAGDELIPPCAPFRDGFDNGAGQWTAYGGTWAIVDSQYTVDAGPGHKSVASGTHYTSFTMEADLLAGAGSTGLIFRGSNFAEGVDSFNGYYAGLHTNGHVEVGRADNNGIQLGTAPMTIAVNTFYHMKVVVSGSLIQVFVADMNAPKVTMIDTSYSGGAIGLRANNSASKFDNVTAKGTFHDSFDYGTDNWAVIDGTWALANRQYTVDSGAGCKTVAKGTNFDDFTYEGNITIAGGSNDCGLIFRGTRFSAGPAGFYGYYAGISTAGNVVLGRMDANWNLLGTAAVAISANTPIHMKVVCAGSLLQVFVTDMDTPKITVRDATYAFGGIGLRTYNCAAKFDSIHVY
jgi:hypothetical protein